MKYDKIQELQQLVHDKLVTARPHPTLPLTIYNYSPRAQSLKIEEWSECMMDCRGLILDDTFEVVGRPFRKFWNYEQVLDKIPNEKFQVWEKLDGSLGIVCNFHGQRVVATRGSFESDQAKFAKAWLEKNVPAWVPLHGLTYLFEIIYPENRIVVDYGGREGVVLLAVMEADGRENTAAFKGSLLFDRAQEFHPIGGVDGLKRTELAHLGEEGYVVRWENGFRAKVKFEEYKRLHRLITQVSTRTIWEILRAGDNEKLEELCVRVPEEFRAWVLAQRAKLVGEFNGIHSAAFDTFAERPIPDVENRFISARDQKKQFAEWAQQQQFPSLLFGIYNRQGQISDQVWKMIEPKWATPFRQDKEE